MTIITLDANFPDDLRKALVEYSELTGQALENITEEALRAYLAWQVRQDAALKAAVSAADRGEFATDEEVAALFARYGATP